MRKILTISIAALTTVAFSATGRAASLTESVIYTFKLPPNGVRPAAALTADAAGNFYGTTYTGAKNGDGTVFELSPPSGGEKNWKEKVLHHFNVQSRGHYPQSAVTLDSNGNLYGVTPNGSKNDAGVAFMLTKPTGGAKQWTETVLHHFTGGTDGGTPYGGLVFGPGGNLYGTTGYGGTNGAGTVFMLSPAGGQKSGWTETVLYNFTNGADGGYPYSIPSFDSAGNLYGTTLNGGNAGNGVVFELSPGQGGSWTEQVVHSFDDATDGAFPRIGVILDASGNLYGTTENGGTENRGTVFEVSPANGGTWTESVLHSFAFTDGANPGLSTLVFDAQGALYGTTQIGGASENGVIFKLTPPKGKGSTWKETTAHTFTGAPDGGTPEAGLILGANGVLTGTTFAGGNSDGNGTIYQLTP